MDLIVVWEATDNSQPSEVTCALLNLADSLGRLSLSELIYEQPLEL